MPVVWTDEVAAGDSDWFADEVRSADYARGCVEVCRELRMALPAGESPALRYLVKAEPPVKSAPTLSGSITGIIEPTNRMVTGARLQAGDIIWGACSSGLGANGISLVIKRAMQLPEQFNTKLPNGRTLGEECLNPIKSYVSMIETLLDIADLHAILPATGDGVGKLAFDHRHFTYRIQQWVEVPILFQYMRELGVSQEDCLKTFNMGIGIYFFTGPDTDLQDGELIASGSTAGPHQIRRLGVVENGPRQVIFEPDDITLPPPGE